MWASSRKGERTSIEQWRSTILPRIARWRGDLAKTSGVSILSFRSLAVWALGYADAALADADHALRDARGIGEAAALMYALLLTSQPHILCGNYATANAQTDEVIALADEKGAAQ